MNKTTTHFGFKEIPIQEKSRYVAEVFTSVAHKYDVMNDFMSLGLHRWWKKITLLQSGVKAGHTVLDLAGGTGDLAQVFAQRVGKNGKIILADINEAMLAAGRERLLNQGNCQVLFVQADAENLPFADNYFDCVSIAFGLRNVTDKMAALTSIYRTIKPGGKVLILEFSKPLLPLLNTFYDTYSFKVIPKLGEWICQDSASYQYLVESIRKHPCQEELKEMMLACGFEDVHYQNMTGGIVALHTGFKY